MWEQIAIPLGILQSVDDIFAALITGGIEKGTPVNEELIRDKIKVQKACRAKFIGTFPSNVFNNTYALLYEVMVTFGAQVFTGVQLESIIDNNRDLILDSPYVNKGAYIGKSGNIPSDDDIINAVTNEMKAKFIELSYKYVDEASFESACNIYISWYTNNLMFYTASTMTAIMSDTGMEIKLPGKRKRRYQGIDDAQEFYNTNVRKISELRGEERLYSTKIDANWLRQHQQETENSQKMEIIDTGLKEVDSVFGRFRRGQMLGILGPTKGGKTRFSIYLTWRALKAGYNVLVWPLEGDKEEWISCLTACIIADISYEEARRKGEGKMIRLSSGDILNRKYKGSKELTKLVAAAETILATGESIGKLEFMNGNAYSEDFDRVLEAKYDESPFDMLVIDSLVNLQSRSNKGKVERISEGYMKAKVMLQNGFKIPVFGVVPAQLKQSVVDHLRMNPDDTIDITAGGESAETIRTPDFTLGVFSSKAERKANQMKMYCVASRHSDSFDDFTARSYLGSCYFLSEEDAL